VGIKTVVQVEIRSERQEDIGAIYDLTKRAFAPMVFAGGNEQDLINAVRDAGALSISLVAEVGSRIVGHVAFTPATSADNTPGWFGLGPVAVEPELQRKGIGQQLINEGLGKLREWNAAGCIVLGDPNYYQRFGFLPFPALAPAGHPPEYFMILPMMESHPKTVVDFHPIFLAGESK
jgi:putative acetyltransferase